MIKKSFDFIVLFELLLNAWAFTLTFSLLIYSNPIYVVLTYPFNLIIVIQPLFCHYLLMLFEIRLSLFYGTQKKMFSRMSKLPFFFFFLYNRSEWWPHILVNNFGLFFAQSCHIFSEGLKYSAQVELTTIMMLFFFYILELHFYCMKRSCGINILQNF